MPKITHVKVPMPMVVAAMSVQRILENAKRFAEDVPDDALNSAEIDRRETVINDLTVLLANVQWRDSQSVIDAMTKRDKDLVLGEACNA